MTNVFRKQAELKVEHNNTLHFEDIIQVELLPRWVCFRPPCFILIYDIWPPRVSMILALSSYLLCVKTRRMCVLISTSRTRCLTAKIYIYLHVYIFICIYMYLYMFIQIYISLYIYIYLYVFRSIHIYLYIFIYIHIYI